MKSTTTPRQRATKPKSVLVPKRIAVLRPSPENDELYRPIDLADPEIVLLAQSIRDHGLMEPLVVSKDNWILSGHRRYAACKLAGIEEVDCRVEPINRTDDRDNFVVLLREYNRQREKDLGEKLREELLDADPAEAHQRLLAYRAEQSAVEMPAFAIRGQMSRSKISDAKAPFLAAVIKVLEDRRKYLPISVRTIHYALLNDPPLRHASKPDSVYVNDVKSYKSLDELLTRARIACDIPMQWVSDETRPVVTWQVHPDPRPFIRGQLNGFLRGYARDLMQSQPNHVEVVGEKNTVAPILCQVVEDYCIPLTTGRGFSSLPPRYEMAVRFRESGKSKLVLLVVSDFDPDGEEICNSFAKSMRDDFGIDAIHCIKVALTAEQVKKKKLPPSMDAKVSSPNFKRFVAKYGLSAFELEALDPEDLQKILRTTIESVIDTDLLNSEVQQEAQDAAEIDAIRRTVRHAIRTIDGLGVEGDDQ